MAERPPFGTLLREHRQHAQLSQLALSMDAGVSARHLSFLEVGRAQPSADMVRRLATALRLGAEARDALLVAAGYAPEHRSRGGCFDIAVAMASTHDPETAVELASHALRGLGVDHFITGTIQRTRAGLVVVRDRHGRPAVGWLRHMQLHDYHDRDYLLAAAASRARPFFWDEVRGDAMRPDQRRILDEATDYRIHTGFVVPIHRPDGSVRAFSSWAERLSDDPRTRTAATLIATSLLDALDRLERPRVPTGQRERLRPEHRDALLRVADGRWRPAATHHEAITQATAAMGASHPAAAASRALALGLLD